MEATYHGVLGLVVLVLKVEVVRNMVLASLFDPRKSNYHVKFTPSFLLNTERGALECCVENSYQLALHQ